jgi:hypothetical protein
MFLSIVSAVYYTLVFSRILAVMVGRSIVSVRIDTLLGFRPSRSLGLDGSRFYGVGWQSKPPIPPQWLPQPPSLPPGSLSLEPTVTIGGFVSLPGTYSML